MSICIVWLKINFNFISFYNYVYCQIGALRSIGAISQSRINKISKKHSGKADQLTIASGGSELA